jgi:PAS domain-containing protein
MEEQSKLAERILDQVAEAVICANPSGAIIRWNHAAAALLAILPRKRSTKVSN